VDDAALQGATIRRALHWIGGALGLAGVVFVVLRLRDYGGEIDLGRFGAWDALLLAGLAATYAAANLLLALAWWHLLAFLGAAASTSWAMHAYAVSQLAKYVPGNIFHLAGRQALGVAAGLPGWALAKSAAWELGMLAIAGALFGLLVAPLVVDRVPPALSWMAFAAALLAAGVLARRRLGAAVASTLGLHASFLAMSGLVFAGTLEIASPAALGTALLPAVCGAYVVAWLAGLITPGAPAGIGVREVVLVLLLGGHVPEAALLVAVVLGRMVTVAGDLAFFAAAPLFHRAERRHARI
jgi:glycosyltransferase 2 family protein